MFPGWSVTHVPSCSGTAARVRPEQVLEWSGMRNRTQRTLVVLGDLEQVRVADGTEVIVALCWKPLQA